MVQAFALKTIHVCKEAGEMSADRKSVVKPAKVDVVQAGKIVELSRGDFDDFEKAGAVRRATKVDMAAADEDGRVDLDDVATDPAIKQPTKATAPAVPKR